MFSFLSAMFLSLIVSFSSPDPSIHRNRLVLSIPHSDPPSLRLPNICPRRKVQFQQDDPSLFVTDLLKGWTLALVLGAPFLAAFLYVFKWAGDLFVPWLMTHPN